jgi:hypothetical protein
VSVSEFFTDNHLKPGAVAPFDGVCIFSDDSFEDTPIVLIEIRGEYTRLPVSDECSDRWSEPRTE